MEQPKPASTRFTENLEDFFTYLITIIDDTNARFPHERPLGTTEPVRAVYKIMNVHKPEDVMRMFITSTHTQWDKVKTRDHSFFETTAALLENITQYVPVKDINTCIFRDIAEKKLNDTFIVDRSKISMIWEYWEAFIKILIDHIHTMRKPKTRLGANGTREAIYTAHYIPAFDIRSACRTWSIDLRF